MGRIGARAKTRNAAKQGDFKKQVEEIRRGDVRTPNSLGSE